MGFKENKYINLLFFWLTNAEFVGFIPFELNILRSPVDAVKSTT